MSETLSIALALLLKIGGAFMLVNEVRGIVLAAPVFYGLYVSGGTLMAIWLAICSLAGIVASVLIPLWVARKLKHMQHRDGQRSWASR